MDSGHAYVARNGDVYFRVKSDPGYGKLSHLNLDDLESGNRELRSRMDDDLKEDPADFAVWKAAKPGEPYWESPWGHGRPGWHIECSAMARKHLGKTIDLHAGGQDLIFPTTRTRSPRVSAPTAAPSAATGCNNGFLNINNEKMSKSANNFFTVREIADKYGYEPIRYFMLTAGYRTPLNYTVELIESCKNSPSSGCTPAATTSILPSSMPTAPTRRWWKSARMRAKVQGRHGRRPEYAGRSGCDFRSGQGTSTRCPMPPTKRRWRLPPRRLMS